MIKLKTRDWDIDNIETMLFDKDGTFIDLHYFWGKMTELRSKEVIEQFKMDNNLFSKLCLYLGYDIETGKMLKDGITALYSRPKIIDIFCENLKECGINTTHQEIETIFDYINTVFYKDMEKYTKPIESAIDFIRNVNRLGIKCGIVTSDSKESTLLTLKHFHWEDLFQSVIGRESTPEHKESGIPAQMALEELGADPKTTIMIGDAPMDYFAAINAGIEKTILTATGQIEKETLLETSSYVVDSLNEIKLV